jgi:hypothetical protein
MVEYIDGYFLQKYSGVVVKDNAKINSESPAWAFDRLSILALKIYHMNEEATRAEASQDHRDKCQAKLNILLNKEPICPQRSMIYLKTSKMVINS